MANQIDSKVSESVSFLLAQICKAHRQAVNNQFADLDLHVGQEMILFQLWQQDGVMQSELAETLCVQPATVTTMLNRMAKANLVQRRRDPEDQRVSRVFLTAHGHSLRTAVIAAWQQVEDDLLANLTREEQVLLRRLLLQLHENLNE